MFIRIRVSALLFAAAFAAAVHAQPLTQRCNWSSLATPAQPPAASANVISSPVVLNLNVPGGFAQIAFISYATAAQVASNSGGVLRVIDRGCNEVARFPNPTQCPIGTVANAPTGFGTTPDLAPVSGLAAGDLDRDGTAELIAVIGSGTGQNRQLAAFNLVGQCLVPRWVSPNTLPAGDSLAGAPAVAQLDRGPVPGWQNAEVVIDNKVFNANGTIRFSGFGLPPANCGGAACPRSRTTIVANPGNGILPQLITGRGIYRSTPAPMWNFLPPALVTPSISNTELTYSAVAELDPSTPGPEIVVTDTMKGELNVLRASGSVITTAAISPTPCGGPPMIADFDGNGSADVGVATCSAYIAYSYNTTTHQLAQMWTRPIFDPSGQTTSTLYRTAAGARIVYNDASSLHVLNAATGAVVQSIPNSSATAYEGPVVASLDTGNDRTRCLMGRGNVIVGANGTQRGVRIFDVSDIGNVASCWNEHTFHVTNLEGSFGAIPLTEAPSWTATSPARNTYRVQAWP